MPSLFGPDGWSQAASEARLAKMSARRRSEVLEASRRQSLAERIQPPPAAPAMTTAGRIWHSIAAEENALLRKEAAGQRVVFRRAVVLKAIADALASRAAPGSGAVSAGGAGEGLSVVEANRPVDLDAALEQAVEAYDDARLRRRAQLAQALRSAQRAADAGGSGGVFFDGFRELVMGLDSHIPASRVAHLYRVASPHTT